MSLTQRQNKEMDQLTGHDDVNCKTHIGELVKTWKAAVPYGPLDNALIDYVDNHRYAGAITKESYISWSLSEMVKAYDYEPTLFVAYVGSDLEKLSALFRALNDELRWWIK